MEKHQLTTVEETITMAKLFAESGMFQDSKQMAQAFVKIQAGKEMGINAFSSMTGINIILGKPTLGAGLIASAIKGSGKYMYKVKEMTDKICSIDFFESKEFIGNSTFTIEDAKKQETKNLHKFPKNMLFARAISNGQKWFCPDVFQMSVYVPEEMPEIETFEDVNHVEVTEVEVVKVPKLTEKQFQKVIEGGKEIIEKYILLHQEGKILLTEEQKELLNNQNQ